MKSNFLAQNSSHTNENETPKMNRELNVIELSASVIKETSLPPPDITYFERNSVSPIYVKSTFNKSINMETQLSIARRKFNNYKILRKRNGEESKRIFINGRWILKQHEKKLDIVTPDDPQSILNQIKSLILYY
jgi:hypothetical protein